MLKKGHILSHCTPCQVPWTLPNSYVWRISSGVNCSIMRLIHNRWKIARKPRLFSLVQVDTYTPQFTSASIRAKRTQCRHTRHERHRLIANVDVNAIAHNLVPFFLSRGDRLPHGRRASDKENKRPEGNHLINHHQTIYTLPYLLFPPFFSHRVPEHRASALWIAFSSSFVPFLTSHALVARTQAVVIRKV